MCQFRHRLTFNLMFILRDFKRVILITPSGVPLASLLAWFEEMRANAAPVDT